MRKKASKSRCGYSTLSAKMNLDYSNPVNDTANSDEINLNTAVEELLDMIDNQIKLDNAADPSNNEKGTKIVLEKATEAIKNEPSQIRSHQAVPFCDCFVGN